MRAAQLFLAAVLYSALGNVTGQLNNNFAPVTQPSENEAVDDGSTLEIRWRTSSSYSGETVRIVLQPADEGSRELDIADGVEYEQAAYNWTVESSKGHTRRYHLRIALDTSAENDTSSDDDDIIYTLSPVFFIVNHESDAEDEERASSRRPSLSRGEIAGIAAGCVVAVIVALISWWLWHFDKRQKRQREALIFGAARGSESGASGTVMVEAPVTEIQRAEIDGRMRPAELPVESMAGPEPGPEPTVRRDAGAGA